MTWTGSRARLSVKGCRCRDATYVVLVNSCSTIEVQLSHFMSAIFFQDRNEQQEVPVECASHTRQ